MPLRPAKLTAMIPLFQKGFDGTEIKEGKLTLDIRSTATADGVTWGGTVGLSTLKALRGGTVVIWEQPIRGEFAGRFGADGYPTFDKLQIASDVIGLNFRGSLESFEAPETGAGLEARVEHHGLGRGHAACG